MQNNPPDIHNAEISAIEEADKVTPPDPHGPMAAFPAPELTLTKEQEEELCQFAARQLKDLDEETGRSLSDVSKSTPGREWYLPESELSDRETRMNSFFGKRLLYELTWQNKLQWRKSIEGSVYQQSNLTLSTSRRITNQRIARFNRFFFEVRPWWAALPEGKADKEFARKLLKIGDKKLHDSGSAAQFRQAIIQSCVHGEAVLKTTRAVDDDHYDEVLNVLIDTTGQPIVAADGDYITEEDLWTEAPLDPLAATAAAGLPTDGAPAPPAMPTLILERDMQTQKQGNDIITPMPGSRYPRIVTHASTEPRLLPRRAVHYQGARTELVYYRDFLCSPGSPSIHKGTIVHLYDIEASELAQAYARDARPETIQAAVDAINSAVEGYREDEFSADKARARASLNEDPSVRKLGAPRLQVGEFYLRCDPANSGITRDIMLIMDVTTNTPIYYNYTAVASPTRRRPFAVVTPSQVDGRWFGIGDMERFDTANDLIDTFLNRAAITQSRAGRVDFFRADQTLEGEANPHLMVNWGGTYHPKANAPDAEKILQSVYLQDNKSGELMRSMEVIMQAATNESGTANANDAAAAGLDTQETATGIQSLDNAGNELTSLPVSELRTGLTEALKDFNLVTFRFHDETETFTFFEGDVPEIMTLPKRDLYNLQVNVSILLTTFYGDKRLAQAQQALGIAKDHRLMAVTDPEGAQILTPLYIDAIQATATENAQDYIVSATQLPMAPAEPTA